MAGRISELDPITGAALTLTDDIEVRDVSDLTMAPTGTNKRTPLSEVILFLQGNGVTAGLIVDDVPPADTSVLWADTTEQGSAASSVLAGTAAPTAGDGNDGDFWINTTTWFIYGPKDNGDWPTGVSLVGPSGGGGGGLDQAAADLRYVNVAGDTVTGSLILDNGITAPQLMLRDPLETSIELHIGGAQRGEVRNYVGGVSFGLYSVTDEFRFDIESWTPLKLSTTAITTQVPVVLPAAAPTLGTHATNKTYVDGLVANRQPLDADLTAIAALVATTGNMILSAGSAWTSATPATVKTALALNNVDNTTDANKPVSTAQATAIGLKADTSSLGALATATVPISVAQGGSGRATATTAYGLLAAGTTATGVQQTVAPAASGFLKTTSTTVLPAWAAIASGDVSGLGSLATKSTIATADITNDAVDNTKLANAAANSFKGNNTGSAADPIDMTVAQAKALLAITEADVANLVTDLSNKQPLDADLTTIAGLTATTDNFIVSVASAWASRTPAQVKTTLAIASTDVSGLGSLATLSAVGAAQITDGSVTNAELATMPASTFKANVTGGVAAPTDAGLPLTVANGGTGRITATNAYGLIAAGTTANGTQQTVAPAASGFLKTTSTTALPAWAAIASTDVSGLGSLATLSAVGAAQITDGVVSNTELSTMPANTIKGNNTGATAAPIDMTVAQLKTLLALDNITVASTAPSSPATNDLWVDTT